MDPAAWLVWLKLIHVGSAFVFAAGHGVSMAVAFRLRHEREPARMLALLDLSAWSIGISLWALLVVLIAGIVDGVVGGYFGRAWTWLAIVLLVVIASLMTPTVGNHLNRVRQALGQRTRMLKPADPDPVALPIDDVLAMTQARGPEVGLAIGAGGFALLLLLMVFKPF